MPRRHRRPLQQRQTRRGARPGKTRAGGAGETRLSGIIPESIVDGPGIRYVVFTQGCPHRCPGCHNPGTHDPEGGYERSTDELIADFEKNFDENPLLDGVTISGGEPMIYARELLPFARAVKESGLNLWIYTGYTIEELCAREDADEIALLEAADALVDGRFVLELRTLGVRFIGSSNQRIIEKPGLYIHTIANSDREE
ncbi:anaerobic ribonucleoside-triphosphate reductase activating protein [Synergistaceae bacterium OttesenSCG-928-I11]|nr:anaerobic ribonucleoside-triphosphate reductase activating protein [Synergistaceae bacterium OttesenSCG-928-I11]